MNNKNPQVESESAATNMCKRGCGFYGSVQFNDMCSKCYHEFIQSEKSTQTPRSISGAFPTPESSKNTILDELDIMKSPVVRPDKVSLKRKLNSTDIAESFPTIEPPLLESTLKSRTTTSIPKENLQRTVNRCRECRKRVGLTGFQCRCEGLFCALHRYSNQHDCTFDYRQQGQAQIARDNPEVRCAKIRKI